jgi:hypothetical protein
MANLLASTVIFLFAMNGATEVPIGTAFIVGYPVPGHADQFVPMVVTARHVIGDNEVVLGRFNLRDEASTATITYDIPALKAAGDYWEHWDDGVDIVVFRTRNFEATSFELFPMELVASKRDFEEQQIQATDRVVYPSLLVNFMGFARNYPITRSGSIALIPDEAVPLQYRVGSRTVQTYQEVILLDGTAVAGHSGSPVFLSPGPRLAGGRFDPDETRPLLLGVLHGFYQTATRSLQSVPTSVDAQASGFRENSDVSIAFPSWKLREILESRDVRTRVESLADRHDAR